MISVTKLIARALFDAIHDERIFISAFNESTTVADVTGFLYLIMFLFFHITHFNILKMVFNISRSFFY